MDYDADTPMTTSRGGTEETKRRQGGVVRVKKKESEDFEFIFKKLRKEENDEILVDYGSIQHVLLARPAPI